MDLFKKIYIDLDNTSNFAVICIIGNNNLSISAMIIRQNTL